MKIKIISLCLICIVISLSCQKEEDFTIGNTESLLLSQIVIDQIPSFGYTYNTEKLINEEKSKFAYTVNHYNENNQLVSTDYYANLAVLSQNPQVFEAAMNQATWVNPTASNFSGTIKYEYNVNGQLVKAIYSPANASPQSSQFSYDENERINRQNLYWEDNQVGYIRYSYDFGGNLIEESLYNISTAGGDEISTTTRYKFDKKQNPFKLTSKLMIPGIYTNRNNIIKEIQTIHLTAEQGGDIVAVTENAYKYNVNGYPIGKNGNVEYVYQ